jgi:TonB-dependent starch-binding outer membrane protein SusC
MKKNRCGIIPEAICLWKSKAFLTMKLTVLAFLIGIMQSFAFGTYAQVTRLNLNMQNSSIKEVLAKVEEKTEFFFLYNSKLVDVERKVDVAVNDMTITDLLNQLFAESGTSYNIVDRQIVLSGNEMPAASPASQQGAVTGKVTDRSGSPLPGVTVVIKGTTTGTITGNDGNFSLTNVPPSGTLVFSFVGMRTQEVAVGNQSTLNISLIEETIGIEEVVAIGYGTMKKSDLTGSVSQVKGDELNAFPSTNIFQALQGRSSGLQVYQSTGAPGASTSIRIRGANSIQGSNEPLYVVDGFPINNPTALNNSDIESIEILKDASSTAIYGSRGANGVVLITTKKGIKGKNNVEFESSYSSQSLIRKMDLMNAREYATLYNIKAVNDKVAPYFTENQINGFGEGFDWQDFIYQTAPIITTALNVNGGDEKTRFSISGSILNQDGIIKGSTYDRYSVRSNLDHQFSRKFSAVLSSTLSHLNTERKDSGGGARGNTLISAQFAPPTLTPFNDDGTYRVLATVYPFVAPDVRNPLNFMNEQSNVIKANIVLINAALIFNPIEELTLKISGGIENRDDRTDSYTTRKFINSDGSASVSTGQFTSLLNENTISYEKSINDKHNISAVTGFTYQNFISTSLSGSGVGFLSDVFETYDLGAAITPGIPGSGYSKNVLLSYLGRINYNYSGKYFVTASFRTDGSSKFSEGNKWGYFPSAALAWRISEEDFMKDNSLISNLKLRASWGETGSQAIGPYVTLNQLNSGKTVFNDALYNTFAPGTNLPGNLKWETTEQIDFGLDFGIMKNLITLTADYYIKNTRDLLNTVTLPSSLGFTRTIQNVGKVQNKGFELGLDAQILNGTFRWDVNSNISFNRNKVVKLYNGEDILGGSVSVVALQDNATILREGRPIGQFWGYMEDGYDDTGKIKYVDLEPDGRLTAADKTYIGDYNPDFIYGLNSNMSYKNFELNIFLQGTYGNDVFNLGSVTYAYDFVSGLNMLREVLTDSWTPTNTNAKYPIIARNTTVNFSDRFIEDGSYLRLKNLQLAYNFPVTNLGLNKIQSLQVYVSGQDLFTITRYSGWDPEVNSQGFGIDNKSYPMSKSFTFGVRARF